MTYNRRVRKNMWYTSNKGSYIQAYLLPIYSLLSSALFSVIALLKPLPLQD